MEYTFKKISKLKSFKIFTVKLKDCCVRLGSIDCMEEDEGIELMLGLFESDCCTTDDG